MYTATMQCIEISVWPLRRTTESNHYYLLSQTGVAPDFSQTEKLVLCMVALKRRRTDHAAYPISSNHLIRAD